MTNNWHLLKVLELRHFSSEGELLLEKRDILNTLHYSGEEFILNILTGLASLPTTYYLGLDNRSAITIADTMTTIQVEGEPSGNSYTRQTLDPGTTDFEVDELTTSSFQMKTAVVTFRANPGDWNIPVTNLFFTNQGAYDGALIASAPLTSQVTVKAGEILTVRLALSLKNC